MFSNQFSFRRITEYFILRQNNLKRRGLQSRIIYFNCPLESLVFWEIAAPKRYIDSLLEALANTHQDQDRLKMGSDNSNVMYIMQHHSYFPIMDHHPPTENYNAIRWTFWPMGSDNDGHILFYFFQPKK